jgi:hypothetical protein
MMRFIRSLLLAALAVCEFKLEAVNVSITASQLNARFSPVSGH